MVLKILIQKKKNNNRINVVLNNIKKSYYRIFNNNWTYHNYWNLCLYQLPKKMTYFHNKFLKYFHMRIIYSFLNSKQNINIKQLKTLKKNKKFLWNIRYD